MNFKAWPGLLFMLLACLFLNAEAASQLKKNVILIGWDGTQRAHLLELLSRNELPNLQNLISEGGFAYTVVSSGATQTKPGWAEILTGNNAEDMEILSNKRYKPVPSGHTVFERLEEHFGENNIQTIFIAGKINNVGARGPHEICMNCISRDEETRKKTVYWDKDKVMTEKTYDNKAPDWVFREGEPYYHAKEKIDLYLNSLGGAENVGKKALAILDKYYRKPFFAFFHFEEPDEQGHLYGENSVEYDEALKIADHWLGAIVEKLKSLGIYENTTIFVTSDHGMDEGGMEHSYAPEMFLATNSKRKIENGDRKDITPTILDEYGINVKGVKLPLQGRSLFKAAE